jgi:hypothetical protein
MSGAGIARIPWGSLHPSGRSSADAGLYCDLRETMSFRTQKYDTAGGFRDIKFGSLDDTQAPGRVTFHPPETMAIIVLVAFENGICPRQHW